MNKRWLYGLYICLSKELSISRSGSLYIINLRSGSATTHCLLLLQIISLSQHFTSRTTIQNINRRRNNNTQFFFYSTFNPPCLKVDPGSFVKVSHNLRTKSIVESSENCNNCRYRKKMEYKCGCFSAICGWCFCCISKVEDCKGKELSLFLLRVSLVITITTTSPPTLLLILTLASFLCSHPRYSIPAAPPPISPFLSSH